MKNIWIFMALIILFPVNIFASSLQELQDIAVKNRKIINKYIQQVEMAQKDILIARKGYYPSIDVAYCDQGFVFVPKPGFQNTPHLSLDVPIHFDILKNDQEVLYTGKKKYRFYRL